MENTPSSWISPEKVVGLASQSRSFLRFSFPAKPPYRATPFFRTKAASLLFGSAVGL
ncbi:MAG: hypothetical protein PHT11_07475 [Synergistaceae bacterium]|nr:hypothetical protein [Synergistaceae bacterium]